MTSRTGTVRARTMRKPPAATGSFDTSGPDDAAWAQAIALCREMKLVRVGIVGEREDGQCRPVSVNMASLNHFAAVVDCTALHFGDYDPSK